LPSVLPTPFDCSHVRHPNVLMILAVTQTPELKNAIITEFMSGGWAHLVV